MENQNQKTDKELEMELENKKKEYNGKIINGSGFPAAENKSILNPETEIFTKPEHEEIKTLNNKRNKNQPL